MLPPHGVELSKTVGVIVPSLRQSVLLAKLLYSKSMNEKGSSLQLMVRSLGSGVVKTGSGIGATLIS